MQRYKFHEGDLPSGYGYGFEQFLFNRKEYRLLQPAESWKSYFLLNEDERCVDAVIHVYGIDREARSSWQSPFGGFEVNEATDTYTLFDFIAFVTQQLKDSGFEFFKVINPPEIYSPKQALIETFLLNQGFSISMAEISSVIRVTQKSFADILHPRKKRKLNQSLPAGLECKTLGSEWLEKIYTFIESHRKQKNYLLSISSERLRLSVNKLPNAYQLFGVFAGNDLVAASVCVRVSKNILYHFISDHVRKAGEARPALVLMNGIYNYCQQEGIALLDLGTSAKGSQPNFKLITFKTEIGGLPSHKFTFTKYLL